MNVILLNFLGGYKFNDGKYNKFFSFFIEGNLYCYVDILVMFLR